MLNERNIKLRHVLLLGIAIVSGGAVMLSLSSATKKAEKSVSLLPKNHSVTNSGKLVYAENCASCHGMALEGQANWRQRDPDGYLPAPPHDKTGHTWHHSDSYLFLMTKYGIEKMIGRKYPNNMPAYKDKLTDEEIIAALSYIKSTWPSRIQRHHDQINARAMTR